MFATTLAVAEPPFDTGVCTHFQQGKGILEIDLALIRQAGATSIRDEVWWGAVETEPGKLAIPERRRLCVDRAIAAGLSPLDYGNRHYDQGDQPRSPEVEAFARYADFVVQEFRGKAHRYEVWNERDIRTGRTTPGDAARYVRLPQAVSRGIQRADPSATVIAGAMTRGGIRKGRLAGMPAGGALRSTDAVSLHTYDHSEPGRARSPEARLDFGGKAREAIREPNGGRDFPLYATEMGWPTYNGARGMASELSAAYLARLYLLARTLPYLKGLWWYDFQDDGWKPEEREHNFGMARPDLTPKPAYWTPASWSAAEEPKRLHLRTAQPGSPPRVREAGRTEVERAWGARDWAGNPRAALAQGEVVLLVGATPRLIAAVPADVAALPE